ncbi:glyoxalase [Mycolicibacterium peregrinum]|uniref:Glyoxalase n=1 Tax=Mycolicibacterium peregrinum TaxID=43304 RepID=A0A1A0RGP7_MYCPR|nr:VOC family protein [Mycolicibacterium peregrinum]OBB33705.1 glyoxalase [Mycolicibacterium peregrinum]
MSESLLTGAIRQIGYVAGDLDAAVAGWVQMGVGPWLVLRRIRQRALYRGEPCEVEISIALANSGELQIEVIQQHGDQPSIYTEFLRNRGEGFHQLAYWPVDFDATLARVEAAGWPVVWSSADEGGVRYAYVEPPAPVATIIELMEFNEVTEGLATFVRGAAQDWDGSEPVRAMN